MRVPFSALVIAAAVACLALPAAAQTPIPIDALLRAPFNSDLVAAPARNRIAWVANVEGHRNLWGAEAPGFEPRQLTRYADDDGQDMTEVAFTPDGEWLVFVRGGDRNQAGEVPNPTSFIAGQTQTVNAVAWRTGAVRLLGDGSAPRVSPADNRVAFVRNGQILVASPTEVADARPLFTARGRNGSPEWSPDGTLLAFVSDRGDHSFIGVYDTTQTTITYVSPSVDRDTTPRWAPGGRELAFIRQPTRGMRPRSRADQRVDPWAIMAVELGTPAAREVWHSAATPEGSLPGLADRAVLNWAAGDRLVFASEHDGWMHLYAIGSAGGTPTLLTPGACEVEQVTWTPDRRTLVFSSNCGDIDRRHLWKVAVAGGTPEPLTRGESLESNPVVTSDGAVVACLGATYRVPGIVMTLPIGGGPSHPLSASLAPRDFPADRLVKPAAVTFKSDDGTEIHGQLFEGAAAGRKPAVIFMHGGPVRQMLLGWHSMYYYHNAYAFNQELASRGYVVLSVNYRSGVGYGRAFREAANVGATGAAEYQDVLAAAKYLRGRPDVDAARIGLWGGSYGGYLTALGLARNSDVFAAGVDMHGVHDWSQRPALADWLNYADPASKELARRSSPIASVATWRAPVLFVHGDDDRNVAFNQTSELVRQLRPLKVTIEQLVFPDEVHDFLLHRHWLAAYTAAADFLDRHLKGAKPGTAP